MNRIFNKFTGAAAVLASSSFFGYTCTCTEDNSSRFLVKDPVHGSIELKENYIRPIIDTKEFQRLRKIKQLGGASYVYPGATHTRFEHSIGVCYIASELLDYLQKNDEKFKQNATESDIKCVKIAALCHDLGHGPFSHLYDSCVKELEKEKKKPAKWYCFWPLSLFGFCKAPLKKKNDKDYFKDHEYRSVEIFKKIRKNNENVKAKVTDEEEKLIGKLITFSEDYKKGIDKWKENNKGKEFGPKVPEQQILDLIEKDPPDGQPYKYPKNKLFLFEIVANGISGIDVDKMDYFLRDGHLTGLPIIFDWRRYVQTLRVLENDKGILHLCSRDKEEHELYQLFHVRRQLHLQVCTHKTHMAVEHLIGEALKKANKELYVRDETGKKHWQILKAWKDIDSFLKLDDSIVDVIMQIESSDTKMAGFIVQTKTNDEEKQKTSGNEEQMKTSGIEKQKVTSGKEQEVTSGEEQEVTSGEEQEVTSGEEQKVTSGNEKQKTSIEEAREILQNIKQRKLCKCIGKSELSKDDVDSKKIEEIKTNFGVEVFPLEAKITYGMGDKNPILFHYFYKKNGDEPYRNKECPSDLDPKAYEEKRTMVYVDFETNDKVDPDTLKEVKKALGIDSKRK